MIISPIIITVYLTTMIALYRTPKSISATANDLKHLNNKLFIIKKTK